MLGPEFGVFAEFRMSDLFSIEPMVEYSSQGGKKNGLQAFPVPPDLAAMFPPGQVPTYLYANFNSEAKINYLMIPIWQNLVTILMNHPSEFTLMRAPLSVFCFQQNRSLPEAARYIWTRGDRMPGRRRRFF